MSRLTHLCLGACTALLLVTGVLWDPSNVTAAPAEPQDGYGDKGCPTIHKIALGENLTLIAAKYEVSVEALVEENGIEDANLIVENQALCIPGKTRGSLNEWGSYGVPGQSYDPDQMSKQGGYGPQENGYSDRPQVKPGESYDPSLYGNQEDWKPESSYSGPGKADEPQSKPEVYWKDEKRYPQGGAIFPEYVPSPDEEPTPTPTPTTPPDDNETEPIP